MRKTPFNRGESEFVNKPGRHQHLDRGGAFERNCEVTAAKPGLGGVRRRRWTSQPARPALKLAIVT